MGLWSYDRFSIDVFSDVMSDWAKLLSQALTAKVDKIPKGFYTSAQLAKKYRLGDTTIQRKLRALISQGKVETASFRIQLSKKVQRVRHYKIRVS